MPRDPYRYFRVEARELLDQLSRGVLDLEKGASRAELFSHLLRLAHTLKGAARVVKQREISDLAHHVEESLASHRGGGAAVPRDTIDGLFATLDAMTARLAQLPEPAVEDGGVASAAAVEPSRPVRTEVSEVDVLLEGLGEAQGELVTMRRAANRAERARYLAALLAEQLAGPRSAVSRQSAKQTSATAKARAMAQELQADIAVLERDVAGGIERMDRELRQARELAQRMRLVPAGSVFNALERVARDAALSTGRRVIFEAARGDVRLDSYVLDTVQRALVQLVRNAVVHGIEPEMERRRAGKPPDGRVTVEVSQRGHRVSLLCRDDGRGVDLDGVRRALQRKGTLPAGAEPLGAPELLDLLLQGGVTTSGTVTELSGRGVGLDLVREVASRLGGQVSAQTAAGAGTAIELRVPVSLASLEALIVQTGQEFAAIPLEAVRATLRVMPEDIVHAAEGDSIVHNGRLIPLIPPVTAPGGTALRGRPFSAVIVAGASEVAAVAVDRLSGIQSIMIRPLPALAPADAIVSGAYVDGEGSPCLVLDPEMLVDPARRRRTAAPTAKKTRPVLVIDDSLTTRMLEQSILESAGYEVELAVSGEEALAKARGDDYGLFLVDVEMPGMDGFAFVERSRADPVLRAVPCILVTSRDSPEDRRRGEGAGASAYIVKSEFDQAEFLDRVARLIRQ